MPLTITVDDARVRAALDKLKARTQDLQPALDVIGQTLENRVSARFETETDPTGAPWADWSARTVKSYPKDGRGKKLQRSGAMMSSLSHTASATEVTVGFGQPYAAYHEFGTVNMARRGLLFADPEAGQLAHKDLDAIEQIASDYLDTL